MLIKWTRQSKPQIIKSDAADLAVGCTVCVVLSLKFDLPNRKLFNDDVQILLKLLLLVFFILTTSKMIHKDSSCVYILSVLAERFKVEMEVMV